MADYYRIIKDIKQSPYGTMSLSKKPSSKMNLVFAKKFCFEKGLIKKKKYAVDFISSLIKSTLINIGKFAIYSHNAGSAAN